MNVNVARVNTVDATCEFAKFSSAIATAPSTSVIDSQCRNVRSFARWPLTFISSSSCCEVSVVAVVAIDNELVFIANWQVYKTKQSKIE